MALLTCYTSHHATPCHHTYTLALSTTHPHTTHTTRTQVYNRCSTHSRERGFLLISRPVRSRLDLVVSCQVLECDSMREVPTGALQYDALALMTDHMRTLHHARPQHALQYAHIFPQCNAKFSPISCISHSHIST